MKAVYRYPLDFEPMQTVMIPAGAELLTIERQTRAPHGLSLWARVSPTERLVQRQVLLVGTGHREIPDEYEWISTYQEANGFVWHFFDGGEV